MCGLADSMMPSFSFRRKAISAPLPSIHSAAHLYNVNSYLEDHNIQITYNNMNVLMNT